MLDQAGLVLPGGHAAGRRGARCRRFRLWLLAVAALLFVMVIVGGDAADGIRPVDHRMEAGDRGHPAAQRGRLQVAFDAYKQIPQYAALNPDMTLDGFKAIYAWNGAIACWRG